MTEKEEPNDAQAPLMSHSLPAAELTLQTYTDSDINLLAEKDVPVVLALPFEPRGDECKSLKIVLSLSNTEQVASRFLFGKVSIEAVPKVGQQLGLTVLPGVVILYRGKPVSILSGPEVIMQSALKNCKSLLSVLESPDQAEESLNKMEKQARKNAVRVGKRFSSESWEMVPLSGLIPGVVMAVSRYHLEGITWLLPTGLAYAFCISNSRLNVIQKFVATAIAFAIGMYWQEILEFVKATYPK